MNLGSVSSRELLEELSRRGGHSGVLADAALLALRKGADYHNGKQPNAADRAAYFPFGVLSYAQMIHMKAMRFVSVAQAPNSTVNFESLADTATDIINYASFYLEAAKQGPSHGSLG